MSKKWKSEFFPVEFVPVPPEMEDAYWAAIALFAEIMSEIILEENAQKEKEIEAQITNK